MGVEKPMIRRRVSGEYEAYLAKQASKAKRPSTVAKIHPHRGDRVKWFAQRFSRLSGRSAVCLGARYGEEVEALQGLGWKATGIDIDEYPPWVVAGDMNQPIEGKHDLIYTNAFDHCWEPERFISNVRAAMNPGGRLVLHLSDGKAGAFETVEWDETEDVTNLLSRSGFTVERVEHIDKFYGLEFEVVAS